MNYQSNLVLFHNIEKPRRAGEGRYPASFWMIIQSNPCHSSRAPGQAMKTLRFERSTRSDFGMP